MNKFEKQLEKWNNGVLRGAQAKLAKTLGVSTATAALWATGKRRPSKGYVAQMAALFGLDVFGVLKLFDGRSTTYPDPAAQNHLRTLRDKNTSDCSYNAGCDEKRETEEYPAQSNSVTLPFLAIVPLKYPHYDECDVIEWWSVPRRYAQGAKYIIRCADAGLDTADADDLCFIKPSEETADGRVMLLANASGKFFLRRVKRQNGKTAFTALYGQRRKSETLANARPLGVAVRRIGGF